MSSVDIEKLIYKKPSLNSFLNPLYGIYNDASITELGPGESGGGGTIGDDTTDTEGTGHIKP